MITMEEFKKMQDGIKDASEDDTPYLAVMDNEMHVVGNPNKTERKAFNYTVLFAFPKQDKYRSEQIVKETDNYLVCKREYKDVFIPARRHSAVVNAFVRVESFIMAITDDGEVKEITEDEAKSLLQLLDDEIIDAVSNAVGKVLNLTPFEANCIIASNAIEVITQMQSDIPEIVNEADLFFGLSQGNQ